MKTIAAFCCLARAQDNAKATLGLGGWQLKARLTEVVQNSSCKRSQEWVRGGRDGGGCLSSKFTEETSNEASP